MKKFNIWKLIFKAGKIIKAIKETVDLLEYLEKEIKDPKLLKEVRDCKYAWQRIFK